MTSDLRDPVLPAPPVSPAECSPEVGPERRLRGGHRRARRPLRLLGVALLTLLAGYLVVLPTVNILVDACRPQPSGRVVEAMSISEHIQLRSVEVLAIAWFLAFSASLGSFLNVVAWRLPRNQGLIAPSHCPHCCVPIRRRDNLPIVGWLLLRGRCRTCHLPISPRYLWVEVLAGVLLVGLALVELLSGGENLPGGPRYPYHRGFVWIVFYTKWDMVRLFTFHGFLFCALLTTALMRWDGLRIPKRFALTCLGVGLLMAAIWPDVHPVLWNGAAPGRQVVAAGWWTRVDTSLLGLGAGLAWGAVLGLAGGVGGGLRLRAGRAAELVFALGLAGLYLGWQAVVSTGLLFAALRLVLLPLARIVPRLAAVPPVSVLGLATVLQVFLWRPLAWIPGWPDQAAGVWEFTAAGLASLLALGLVRAVAMHPRNRPAAAVVEDEPAEGGVRRQKRDACPPIVIGSLLLVVCGITTGCGTDRGETEAGHRVPGHKPADYPAAVRRLQDLHAEILRETPRQPGQLDAFTEFANVVHWLPELAADSDLSETAWNRVAAAAEQLRQRLTRVQQARAGSTAAYRAEQAAFASPFRELQEVARSFPNPDGPAHPDLQASPRALHEISWPAGGTCTRPANVGGGI